MLKRNRIRENAGPCFSCGCRRFLILIESEDLYHCRCANCGEPKDTHRTGLRLSEIKWMAHLYLKGDMSLTEVAAKMHVGVGTVHRYLSLYDIPIRPPRMLFPNKQDPERWREEAEAIDWHYHGLGMNQRDVAQALGMTPGTVSRRMDQFQIPKRTRAESIRRRKKVDFNSVLTDEGRASLRENARRQWKQGGPLSKGPTISHERAVARQEAKAQTEAKTSGVPVMSD